MQNKSKYGYIIIDKFILKLYDIYEFTVTYYEIEMRCIYEGLCR